MADFRSARSTSGQRADASAAAPSGRDLAAAFERLRREQVQLAADQRQLQAKRAQLEALQTELARREAELARAVEGLQEERRRFESQRAALEADLHRQQEQMEEEKRRQDDLLAKRKAELDALAEDLHRQREQLAEQQRHLDNLRRAVEQQRLEVERRQSAIQSQAERLQAESERLNEASSRLRAREEDLKRRSEELAAMERELRRQGQLLEKQNIEIQRRRVELADAERAVEQAQQRLEERARQIAERESQLRQKEADLLARQRQINQGAEQITAEKGRVENLAGKLAQQQAEIERQMKALQAERRRLESLKARLDEQQRHLNAERSDLQRIRAEIQALKEQAGSREPDGPLQVLSEPRAGLAAPHVDDAFDDLVVSALANGSDAGPAESDAGPAAAGAGAGSVPSEMVPGAGVGEGVLQTGQLPAQAVAKWRPRMRSGGISRGRFSGIRQVMPGHVSWIFAGCVAIAAAVGASIFWPAEYRIRASLQVAPHVPNADRLVQQAADRMLASLVGLMNGRSEVGIKFVDVERKGSDGLVTVTVRSMSPDRVAEELSKLLEDLRRQIVTQASQTERQRQLLQERIEGLKATLADLLAKKGRCDSAVEQIAASRSRHKALSDQIEALKAQLEEHWSRIESGRRRLKLLRSLPLPRKVQVPEEVLRKALAEDTNLSQTARELNVRNEQLRALMSAGVQNLSDAAGGLLKAVKGFAAAVSRFRAEAGDSRRLASALDAIGQEAQRLEASVRSVSRLASLAGRELQRIGAENASASLKLCMSVDSRLTGQVRSLSSSLSKIDGLVEDFTKSGQDITRRTVIQQKLRAALQDVRRQFDGLASAARGLQPAMNFRLDAALSSVSALSRRLQQRRAELVAELQRQQADLQRRRRQEQIRQIEQQVDSLQARCSEITQKLLQLYDQLNSTEKDLARLEQMAERSNQLQAQISSVQAEISQAEQDLQRLSSLASQPNLVGTEGPFVDWPPVNAGQKVLAGALAGGAAFVVAMALAVLGAALAAERRKGP